MSGQWEEPEVLVTLDRSFGDKHEQLRLERGQYQGRPTFTLRVYWQTPEGQWRWSAAKPSANGKTWASLSLKARELRELGEALIKAAESAGTERSEPRQRKGLKRTPEYDGPPPGKPYDGPGHDSDLPF